MTIHDFKSHRCVGQLHIRGFVYTNLEFSVYNNSFIVGNRDGFQILVDRFDQTLSPARLEIDVSGNNLMASGLTVEDLVKVLSSSRVCFGSGGVESGPKS